MILFNRFFFISVLSLLLSLLFFACDDSSSYHEYLITGSVVERGNLEAESGLGGIVISNPRDLSVIRKSGPDGSFSISGRITYLDDLILLDFVDIDGLDNYGLFEGEKVSFSPQDMTKRSCDKDGCKGRYHADLIVELRRLE